MLGRASGSYPNFLSYIADTFVIVGFWVIIPPVRISPTVSVVISIFLMFCSL